MPRSLLLSFSLGLSLFSVVASAQDTPRRALASCMTKRMMADRTISYNEAQRSCKDQGKGSDATVQTAANAEKKPVG